MITRRASPFALLSHFLLVQIVNPETLAASLVLILPIYSCRKGTHREKSLDRRRNWDEIHSPQTRDREKIPSRSSKPCALSLLKGRPRFIV